MTSETSTDQCWAWLTSGAFLILPIWFTFSLGFAIRACLADRPFLWGVALELFLSFLDHFTIYVGCVLAAFIIGYFVRLKPLLIVALAFGLAAFAVGYAVAVADACTLFI